MIITLVKMVYLYLCIGIVVFIDCVEKMYSIRSIIVGFILNVFLWPLNLLRDNPIKGIIKYLNENK